MDIDDGDDPKARRKSLKMGMWVEVSTPWELYPRNPGREFQEAAVM
jgi:hypothetical protein